MFDFGQYRSNNDSGVLLKTKMERWGKKLAKKALNITPTTALKEYFFNLPPYCFD